MIHRRMLSTLLAGAALALAACADSAPPTAPETPGRSPGVAGIDPQQIPTRGEQRAGTFVDLEDARLWEAVLEGGGRAVVGLKSPDVPRGVWRGQVLVSRDEWDHARERVLAYPGVSLLRADDLLPVLEVEVRNPDALRRLRRLAWVDYVEPVLDRDDLPQRFAGVGGCGWGSGWNGDTQYTSTGDLYTQKYTAMGIPAAWNLASGSGVTIGITDTGISSTQAQLLSQFDDGQSAGRTIRYFYLSSLGSAWDTCGHGTRMTGVAAAPRDGRSVTGVAWGANVISVRQANGVAAVSSSDAKYSVRAAAQNGSDVVVMAWESLNWWWQVSDEIEYWHYNYPVLFLGAAGTSGCGDVIWDDNVVFPADMGEVVAVTGVTYPSGGVPCGIHYGPEVELTAYLDVPTVGQYTGDVTGIGGSSNATAIMGGIAALVWSRNPGLTRDQLRQRLRQSASYYPNRHSREGYGLVDAYRAVTGT